LADTYGDVVDLYYTIEEGKKVLRSEAAAIVNTTAKLKKQIENLGYQVVLLPSLVAFQDIRYVSNAANSQIIVKKANTDTTTYVFTPRLDKPVSELKDAAEVAFQQAGILLENIKGIKLDDEMYRQRGQVHCATNASRTPIPKPSGE
jgi:hypothetical protein